MKDFEDDQPNVRPTDSPLPPPPKSPDTEPSPAGDDPVLAAVRAVHKLVTNLAIKVDSFEHKIDHAVDLARASCSASVLTSDTMKQIRKDLTTEHIQVMGALDEIKRTFGQALISVSEEVRDQRQVLHEHQRRIDEFDSSPHAATNGNGIDQ